MPHSEGGDRTGLFTALGNQALILWARGELEEAMALHQVYSRTPHPTCASPASGETQNMELQLAEALAALTTGIYVLTVRADGVQHGMSSSWATQVSGDPVLLMAAVDQQHFTHQMILSSGAFALNIVGAQGKHLEDYFYSAQARRPDNLAPFALETGATGTPLLRDALASLDCRLVSTHAAGDHTLFVGAVVEARVRTADRPLTSRELPYVYLGGTVVFDQTSRRPLG